MHLPRQCSTHRPCLPSLEGETGERIGAARELTAAHENLVRAVLITQLWSVALAWLELDGNLLLIEQIGALKDDAERALADLLADAVVDADDVGGCAAARHCG